MLYSLKGQRCAANILVWTHMTRFDVPILIQAGSLGLNLSSKRKIFTFIYFFSTYILITSIGILEPFKYKFIKFYFIS